MSANEVLQQVKALPPRERRKFFKRVHDLETAIEAEPSERKKRRVCWPDAAARRRGILALGIFRRILTRAQVRAGWSDVERDLRSCRLIPQPVNWMPQP